MYSLVHFFIFIHYLEMGVLNFPSSNVYNTHEWKNGTRYQHTRTNKIQISNKVVYTENRLHGWLENISESKIPPFYNQALVFLLWMKVIYKKQIKFTFNWQRPCLWILLAPGILQLMSPRMSPNYHIQHSQYTEYFACVITIHINWIGKQLKEKCYGYPSIHPSRQ